MQYHDSINSISPSFTNNCSNNNLADIAARVVEEFRNQHYDDDIYNNIFTHNENQNQVYVQSDRNSTIILNNNNKQVGEEVEEEKEFEFAVVCKNPNYASYVSADEIFSNGEILPKYPLFDRSLLFHNNDVVSDENKIISVSLRQPLGKLFREERETTSLSDGDNLAGVTPGTYCIWKPKVESPEKCKKSNSTGNSSKRWRFRNLLQRSNSDGNMSAGKHAPVNDFGYFSATKKKGDKTAKVAGADDDGEVTPVTEDNNCSNKGGFMETTSPESLTVKVVGVCVGT